MRITLRRATIGVALAEVALLLGLVVYLAATEKTLLVRVATREELKPAATAARLVIPVAGVREHDLADSYGAGRSGGRKHKGVDIFAPDGTPVLAASGGVIVKRASNALGGTSLYHRDADGRTIYYYAHLQRYRAGLKEGDLVRAGDVIGYVGHTGNAPPGNPHLHFAVYTVSDPNRWWRGRDLNPYPLLVKP
ncbi:MAG TPA: M23 family metallopeptidase [Longimicrobium sp.]|jgi:murein DD-endopeptidase MepM/ murein hydrolase activator NlpD